MSSSKERLWIEIVLACANQLSAGMRMNAAIEVADATVDRFERRFEPDEVETEESIARRAAVTEDAAIQQRLQDAYYESEKRKAADKIRSEGPWAVGTRLLHKPTSAVVVVVEDDKQPQVKCRLVETKLKRERPLLRVDLEWANDADVTELHAAEPSLTAVDDTRGGDPAPEPEAEAQAGE